jgi:hypothetical protein
MFRLRFDSLGMVGGIHSESSLQPGRLRRTHYIFDQTGSKTDTWNDQGLNQHGPYTSKVFTPNRPRLCVICHKAQKGSVEQFLQKFINGIVLPPPAPGYAGKPQRKYFEKGFLWKYALQDVTYEFFLAEDRICSRRILLGDSSQSRC